MTIRNQVAICRSSVIFWITYGFPLTVCLQMGSKWITVRTPFRGNCGVVTVRSFHGVHAKAQRITNE